MGFSRNEIKISFYDGSTFQVNEKNHIVTCKLAGVLRVPVCDGEYSEDKYISSKGRARCSVNDTFDVQTGKKIALAKAEKAIYCKAKKILEKKHDDYRKRMTFIENFLIKANNVIEHNNAYVKNY